MPGAVKRQFCSVTKNDFETYISSASVIIKSKNRPVTCFYPKGTVTTVQSTGIPILTTACSANKSEPSPVLMALGIPKKIAQGGLRITLGEDNTKEEMDYTVYCIKKAVQQLRENNPLYSRFSEYNLHHWSNG